MRSSTSRAATVPEPRRTTITRNDHHPRHRTIRLGGVLLAAAIGVAAAGCGSSSSGAAATATTAGTPASPATTVTATETEFHIALSSTTLDAGRWTFVAHNGGSVTHALAVSGPGLSSPAETSDIQPGASADLTVTLAAGTYDVYCPVGDHKALGMNVEVTVR